MLSGRLGSLGIDLPRGEGHMNSIVRPLAILVFACIAMAGCEDSSGERDSDDTSMSVDDGGQLVDGFESDGVASHSDAGVSCHLDGVGATAMVQVYHDIDKSDRSSHVAGITADDEPATARLMSFGADGSSQPLEDCGGGRYATEMLDDGVHLIHFADENDQVCATGNCPRRFTQRLAAGRPVKMVTFGDSIAVVGDRPLFPERLAQMFSALGEVENQNLAIGGTTSEDWLPTTSYFVDRVIPNISDADLIVLTMGGNDILAYVSALGIPNDIPAAVDGARDVVRQVVDNVTEIIAEIRAINPDADIAYCLYADYSQATGHPVWGLVGNFLGADTVGSILELARDSIPRDLPGLLLVDMFGAAQGLPLHEYLYDQLHFNARGQALYAEELFMTLGGVLVGPSPMTDFGRSPLGLERNYGLVIERE